MTLSLVHVHSYRKAIAELPTPQAETKLIALWLDGKAPSSVRAYQQYTKRFLQFLGKPLKLVTYEDLVEYATQFTQQAESTRRMYLATAKSLISFAHKIGYIPFNVGMALKLGNMPDAINERYLDEADVKLMQDLRNRHNAIASYSTKLLKIEFLPEAFVACCKKNSARSEALVKFYEKIKTGVHQINAVVHEIY